MVPKSCTNANGDVIFDVPNLRPRKSVMDRPPPSLRGRDHRFVIAQRPLCALASDLLAFTLLLCIHTSCLLYAYAFFCVVVWLFLVASRLITKCDDVIELCSFSQCDKQFHNNTASIGVGVSHINEIF